MWNADSKLSYILSSSIQIFIFSGDSMPVGIGNEILSLLLLIFCFKLSPALQEKKKTKTLLSSVFTGCSLWRRRRIRSELTLGQNCKSSLAFALVSSGSSYYHHPPPSSCPASPFLRVHSALS